MPRAVSIAPVQPTQANSRSADAIDDGRDLVPDHREPLLAAELAHALGDDPSAQVGDRAAHLDLADVDADDVAGVGPERERARRPPARPFGGGHLREPAQPHELVRRRIHGRPRETGHRHQFRDAQRPAGPQDVEDALRVHPPEQSRGRHRAQAYFINHLDNFESTAQTYSQGHFVNDLERNVLEERGSTWQA